MNTSALHLRPSRWSGQKSNIRTSNHFLRIAKAGAGSFVKWRIVPFMRLPWASAFHFV